ncbi:MAG: HPF/RaiA family ribosome-associated protein [Pirellulales bacterium]|nr:HPF/RaiA family ribosome-associated protein [Pirellulales bacterium]
MRFSVSGQRVKVTTELREYIDRRFYFALARYGRAVDHVSVRVGDINGPRGGVDKHCQIVVNLRAAGSSPIVIDEYDQNLRAAVARASNRAGRTVARALERARHRWTYQRRRSIAGADSQQQRPAPEETRDQEAKDHAVST